MIRKQQVFPGFIIIFPVKMVTIFGLKPPFPDPRGWDERTWRSWIAPER
jgi:hypothetical protein